MHFYSIYYRFIERVFTQSDVPLIWKGLVKPPNNVQKTKIVHLSQVIKHRLGYLGKIRA